MGLREYRRKRSFTETPEPKGRAETSEKHALRFVVQKHDASHLHYDFRLELGGVLKSWAIPKGPSSDPGEKRYAVQVEDHPLEYRLFEGTIPEGNYGAGEVEIWDEGTYRAAGAGTRKESEKALARDLERGRVSFVMSGKRLKGEFALVRMKGKGWLLIKKKEKGAEVSAAPVTESKAPAVTPMLATLVDKPFDHPGWLFEVKWDGYRAVAQVEKDRVELFSRNHKSFNARYPSLVDSLKRLGHEAVLDGEIVAIDASGKSSFQLLQNQPRTHEGELVYYVFDLLRLDGRDCRELPLLERKALLQKLLTGMADVRYSEHVLQRGKAVFESLREQGVEGMMAKRADSTYREGERSPDWLKVKARLEQEAVIAGFTDPRGTRKRFGALVLGVYDGKTLVYSGRSGTGFDKAGLDSLYRKMKPLIQDECPFAKCPRLPGKVHWLRPKLVCEVLFHEWTTEGLMRQAAYLGLREDLKPSSVKREIPRPTESLVAGKAGPRLELVKGEGRKSSPRRFSTVKLAGVREAGLELDVGGHAVKVTHLEKIYWPGEGRTKGDLIDYYRQVAPILLPYLKDRPHALHRHPNGVGDEGFYQQSMENRTPDWVTVAPLPAESGGGKKIRYVVCQNEATLVYLANLGCIELNPWLSRLSHPDNPDYLVLDLDPVDIAFPKVREVALAARDILDGAGIESHCKTSGKRGIHLCVPLGAKYDYDDVKNFAEVLALLVHRKLPRTTSLERSPAKRKHKVYLDYLRNSRGQTVAAPYSVRPCPGAPVSTPVSWDEVEAGFEPGDFNMENLCRRLDRVGDLFEPVMGDAADLRGALARLRAAVP